MSTTPNDEFTHDLNERIKELEDMTDQLDTTPMNTTHADGDTIFFTANIASDTPIRMNITNNNGETTITGADIDHIEIAATRTDGHEVDHAHWFFQQVDNEVTLRPNWQVASHVNEFASKIKSQLKDGFKTSDWSRKDFIPGLDINYDLSVRVPRNLADGSRLTLRAANGDTTVRDLHAAIDAKSANGDLTFAHVVGALSLQTANGEVKVSDITGAVSATAASGDISLTDVTGAVDAGTANGDITLEHIHDWMAVRTANGDISIKGESIRGGRAVTVGGDIDLRGDFINNTTYEFDTVTGDVDIDVRVPSAGASLKVKTVRGNVEVSDAWVSETNRKWTLGAGEGPTISVKSVNGGISIKGAIADDLTLLREEAEPETSAESDTRPSGEVNINLDIEMERIKGWARDFGNKVGDVFSDIKFRDDAGVQEADETPTATAERRTRLLEAVKNGEMTVDEALAELEKDA